MNEGYQDTGSEVVAQMHAEPVATTSSPAAPATRYRDPGGGTSGRAGAAVGPAVRDVYGVGPARLRLGRSALPTRGGHPQYMLTRFNIAVPPKLEYGFAREAFTASGTTPATSTTPTEVE